MEMWRRFKKLTSINTNTLAKTNRFGATEKDTGLSVRTFLSVERPLYVHIADTLKILKTEDL